MPQIIGDANELTARRLALAVQPTTVRSLSGMTMVSHRGFILRGVLGTRVCVCVSSGRCVLRLLISPLVFERAVDTSAQLSFYMILSCFWVFSKK